MRAQSREVVGGRLQRGCYIELPKETKMHLGDCVVDSDLDSIESLVAPISGKEFLRETWGNTLAHMAGPREKFKELFSWELLNEVLERHRLEPPRLRLYKGGNEIPVDEYLLHSVRQDGTVVRSVKSFDLTKQLIEGATLILDSAEEVSPSLRDLCVRLERIFRRKVVANLYAGFRTDNGFALHWDIQDTLVLQVEGRKRWLIYAPTNFRSHGWKSEQIGGTDCPPTWDGLLEQGCLLHIPRGWPHVAYPVDEPSLHLTVSIQSLTGVDLLSWFVQELRRTAFGRRNIPIWETPDKLLDYAEKLKQEFIGAWAPDLAWRFIDEMDSRVIPRPRFHLPEAVGRDEITTDENTYLTLSSAGRAVVSRTRESGRVKFRYSKRVWTCAETMVPILSLVNDGRRHPVRELCATASSPEHGAEIRQFINELVHDGILIVA